MRPEEIIEFVRERVEPIPPTSVYGERFRVSARLNDETFLPCVVIESLSKRVELALRRFDESRRAKHPSMGYESIVASFIGKGNRINDYDIKELTLSSWAIPLIRAREIGGETSMSWTEFYATMRDGSEFRFASSFLLEFFDMPAGYSGEDIVKIVPAVRGEKPRQERIFREKPFFTCYVAGV